MPRPHVNIKLAPQKARPEKCSDVRGGRVASKWVDVLSPYLDPFPTVQHLEELVRYHGGLKRSARVLSETSNPVHIDSLRSALSRKSTAPSTLVRAVCMLRWLRARELLHVPLNLHDHAISGKISEVRTLVLRLGSPGQASRYLQHIGVSVSPDTLRRWALSSHRAGCQRILLVTVLAGLTYLSTRLGQQKDRVRTTFMRVTPPTKLDETKEPTMVEIEQRTRLEHLAMINLSSGKRSEDLKYPLSKANIERLSQDPTYQMLLPYAYPYPPDPSEIETIVKKCGGPRTVSIKLLELYQHNVRIETIRELTRKQRPRPVWKTIAYLRMLSAQHPKGIRTLPANRGQINTGKSQLVDLRACVPLREEMTIDDTM